MDDIAKFAMGRQDASEADLLGAVRRESEVAAVRLSFAEATAQNNSKDIFLKLWADLETGAKLAYET